MIMNTKTNLYAYLLCALFAALAAICSQIMVPLPFTPVPINLALLAVWVCGGVLGPKKGAIAMLVYILLGVIGVPVFAGLQGGIGVLAGPTGGFIIGYVPSVIVYGYFLKVANGAKKTDGRHCEEFISGNDTRSADERYDKGLREDSGAGDASPFVSKTKRAAPAALSAVLKFSRMVALGLPAVAACYAPGTAWFVISTGTGVWAALLMCVIPFIPGDILKLIAASAACEALRKPLRALKQT